MIAEEIKDMKLEEAQELLQKRVEEYTAKVSEIKDLDELKRMEDEIDKQQEEYDEYIKKVEYPLNTEGVEFEGKHYSIHDIAKKIVYYLNRIEQDFQYCLGLHGLVLLWKNADLKIIGYGAYDSTLRLLGGLKFKGDSEWVDILIINNFLTCAHEAYVKDRSGLITLASMRNAVVNRIQLCSKIGDEKGTKSEE